MLLKYKFSELLTSLLLVLTVLLPLTANSALADNPTVTVVAPSHEVGDLGAALGNTWTMDSESDVAWTQPNASGATVDYEVRSGVAGAYGLALRGVTPKGSDLATAFYADANVELPDQTYRYLIYRSFIAPHQPGEAGKEGNNGRVLYSSGWGPNWLFQAFPQRRFSKSHRMCGYGQWCVYFFDLHQDIKSPLSPNRWDWGEPDAVVKAFGLWPHENWGDQNSQPSGDSPDYFYLDYVYLTGPIVTTPPPDSRYLVRWNVSDPDGGQLTSKLYYQERDELLLPSQAPTCNSSLTGWAPVPGATTSLSLGNLSQRIYLPLFLKGGSTGGFGSGVIGAFNQSFNWSLSGGTYEAGKVYYVCVVVEDQNGNKGYGVSSAPVIKIPAPTTFGSE